MVPVRPLSQYQILVSIPWSPLIHRFIQPKVCLQNIGFLERKLKKSNQSSIRLMGCYSGLCKENGDSASSFLTYKSDVPSYSILMASEHGQAPFVLATTHMAIELLPILLCRGEILALPSWPPEAIFYYLFIIPKVCLKYTPPLFLLLPSYPSYSFLLKASKRYFEQPDICGFPMVPAL